MKKSKKVIVIGSGFAGLATAALLGKAGYQVIILEKNEQPGGRARRWEKDGFTFDMGPSWYWMPDVFENFFNLFGKSVSEYYDLVRLDPSYRVYFGEGEEFVDVPANMQELEALFEKEEPGSSKNLRTFLEQAAYKYEVGMRDYVHRPSHSIFEFLDFRLIRESFRIQMFSSMRNHVRKYFTNPRLIKILEFPVLFLGATPANTPALYSMMNHADLTLGTWYPMGGMYKIVEAMVSLAEEQGVEIKVNTEVEKIIVKNGVSTGVATNQGEFHADIIIANSDYQHTDQMLLDQPWRNYNPKYWDKRVMSPSSLLFYIGLDKKLEGIKHHSLFFDEDFDLHAEEIYSDPKWPSKPLFYLSSTSQTDPSVAPEGHENLFLLIPLAPGLEDTEAQREAYYHIVMDRLEKIIGQDVRNSVVLKRSYAMKDFEKDYHSFKGNAYGLANTLFQTAFFKPKLRSKKVKNLYYTGHLTVPGPGVPPSLISGEIVADEVIRNFI
ncbi:MAG: phytoene desaturase [Bacteroidetes bacterium]|nr:phytoene desaturase [Bacteroidota bacterium]MCB0853555.1 phytoene desaturase [Bacteroidota bacterium]